jgi:molybdenum cofactor biosynthesis enzyme
MKYNLLLEHLKKNVLIFSTNTKTGIEMIILFCIKIVILFCYKLEKTTLNKNLVWL